jgi:4'-phosphopantetheinyl transferase
MPMRDQDPWYAPLGLLRLADNEVHVWRAGLQMPASIVEHLQHVLVQEELERARGFYFEKDRFNWIVAHSLLRSILGQYLTCDPRSLRFTTNSYGKPLLVSPVAGKRLHFNLSHSGDLALYAFAYEREVGVDVEQMRAGIDYRELATRYFSVRECAALEALSADLQQEAFFLCWSRKEAYIKARGEGLSLPLDQFDVSLVPGEPPRLLGSREEPGVVEYWSLYALSPGSGYSGALAIEGSGWQLRCWQWQGETGS